jgi:hypothetical protein
MSLAVPIAVVVAVSMAVPWVTEALWLDMRVSFAALRFLRVGALWRAQSARCQGVAALERGKKAPLCAVTQDSAESRVAFAPEAGARRVQWML